MFIKLIYQDTKTYYLANYLYTTLDIRRGTFAKVKKANVRNVILLQSFVGVFWRTANIRQLQIGPLRTFAANVRMAAKGYSNPISGYLKQTTVYYYYYY